MIYSKRSDIDIAIIFQNKLKDRNKLEIKIKNSLIKISEKSKKEIMPIFFTKKELKENKKSDLLIRDILRNGKKLF